MPHITVPIRGMHCASCEILISDELKKIQCVTRAKVDQKRARAEIFYVDREPSALEIESAVRDAGYEVGDKQKLPWFSSNRTDYKDLFSAAVILFLLYEIGKRFNLFSLSVDTTNTGVAVALLVGLVAGVSTCMALVGGLVLSLAARHAELHPEANVTQKFRPHISFNLGRVLGYTVLGGVIGLLGKAFVPSANLLGTLTMVVGGIMIFFGLKLIEIFPALHDKNITLPSGIARFFGLKREIKEYSHRTAFMTGVLTFFLPCGFTQAMQMYALGTGSFMKGALVMGLFATGTSVGLLGIGGLSSVFKGHKARIFSMIAGLTVILLGWRNIANGSNLISRTAEPTTDANAQSAEIQVALMTQSNTGYTPNTFTVEKGKPVKWVITSTSSFTCTASIVLPTYGISQSLRLGENIIVFTPTEVGEAGFSCSMGMYRGKFIVVERSGKDNTQATTPLSSVPSSAGQGLSCGSGGCGCMGGGKKQPQQVGEVQYQTLSGDKVSNTEFSQTLNTTYTYKKDIAPNTFTVRKGQKVKLIVDAQEDGRGCMSSIMVPGLYNSPQYLQAGTKIEMGFTPEQTGDYPITCAMGVPRGVIHVVDRL